MDDVAFRPNAQIAKLLPGPQHLGLLLGQPLLRSAIFSSFEHVDQFAGGAPVGFVHEIQVGSQHGVDHRDGRPRRLGAVGDFDDVRQAHRVAVT